MKIIFIFQYTLAKLAKLSYKRGGGFDFGFIIR